MLANTTLRRVVMLNTYYAVSFRTVYSHIHEHENYKQNIPSHYPFSVCNNKHLPSKPW